MRDAQLSRLPGPAGTASSRARPRGHVRLAGVALLVAGAIVAGLALTGLDGGAGPSHVAVPAPAPEALRRSGPEPAAAARPARMSVSIDARHPGAAVPPDFLGLSFELSAVAQIAAYANAGDLVGMLRSLGTGVLRFGGVSADTRVAWTDAATPLPSWASAALDVGELRALRKLAQRSGWRIVLTIGLAHFDPRAAAREASAAKMALGRWLAGFELGNEPDAYARHGLRPPSWDFSGYQADVTAYRRAIAKTAPGVRLIGPDVSGSLVFETWGPRTAATERPLLLTGHHYPLGCHDVPRPSIARLLSPEVRRAEDTSLRRYLAVSRASAIGFRLDEANSVSCGGAAGVSNTFASALWAVDYIARAMAAGAVGINLHGNPANCRGYTPVCAPTPRMLARGALSAQPEWYALLLSSALIGDRPVRSAVRPRRPNVDIRAMLDGRGGLHVVVIDDDPAGASGTAISLHLGRGVRAATVLSLSARSRAATGGVRLGGRSVARDGSWHAPRGITRRADRAGVITLTVYPGSAALVSATTRMH